MTDAQQDAAQHDTTPDAQQFHWQRMTLHDCPSAYTQQRIPSGTVCGFCGVEQRAPVKLYRVERRADGVSVIVAQYINGAPGGDSYALPKTMWHGSAWEFGFGGSGAADLALSILADYFGEAPTRDQLYHGRQQCWPLHQSFKWAYITPRVGVDAFDVSSVEIDVWLVRQDPPEYDLQELP